MSATSFARPGYGTFGPKGFGFASLHSLPATNLMEIEEPIAVLKAMQNTSRRSFEYISVQIQANAQDRRHKGYYQALLVKECWSPVGNIVWLATAP
jgi:hypothetical protein